MRMSRCIRLNCLILGSILLAAVVVHVQGNVTTIYTMGGLQRFRSTSIATACELFLPDGETCTYSPLTTPPPHKKCTFPNSAISPYCIFQVEILSKPLSGIYILNANGTDGVTVEDRYELFLHTGKFPNDKITVIEDENMYLRMAGSFNDAMNCVVVYPNNTREFLAAGPTVLSPNYWGAEGECGVLVDGVADRHEGKWKLEVTSNSAYVYTEFEVQVTFLNETDTRPRPPIEWIFGDSGNVSMSQPNSKYCELWNPNNELVQRSPSDCSYTQNIVTDADNGNWTIVFGMNGKLTEDKFIQKIKVIKGDLEVIVSESERFQGGLDLLCRISPGEVTDCRFKRPDGQVLLLAEGIGNANYNYFGDGFSNGDCGLTIHQLQEVDMGWWECSVTVGETERSGFLNVSATGDPDVGTYEALTVVRNGSEIYLSCRAQDPLEYCWFRHPTGLHIRFSTELVSLDGLPETYSPRSYKYNDTLQSGVCSLTVSRANITVDRGQWTCHLGVLGSPEEGHAVPITVEVSDSEVVSLVKELVISSEPAVLKCSSVPLGRPLQYCRFIRPDGKGFNVVPGGSSAVLGRYGYEAEGLEKGECGLRIVSGTAEDEGQWTCVAKLQGKKQEDQDFIVVKINVESAEELSVGAIVGIAVGGAVVLLLIAGLIFFIVRCKQQA